MNDLLEIESWLSDDYLELKIPKSLLIEAIEHLTQFEENILIENYDKFFSSVLKTFEHHGETCVESLAEITYNEYSSEFVEYTKLDEEFLDDNWGDNSDDDTWA